MIYLKGLDLKIHLLKNNCDYFDFEKPYTNFTNRIFEILDFDPKIKKKRIDFFIDTFSNLNKYPPNFNLLISKDMRSNNKDLVIPFYNYNQSKESILFHRGQLETDFLIKTSSGRYLDFALYRRGLEFNQNFSNEEYKVLGGFYANFKSEFENPDIITEIDFELSREIKKIKKYNKIRDMLETSVYEIIFNENRSKKESNEYILIA